MTIIFILVGVSRGSNDEGLTPHTKVCNLIFTPAQKIKIADIPVMLGEQAFLYLQVKGIQPSPEDDVEFLLISPSGNITRVKGSNAGAYFRGSAQITEKGSWNIIGRWRSIADSCEVLKRVEIISDGFVPAIRFDEASGVLTDSFSLGYPRGPGNIMVLLLDEGLTQNHTILTLSLGSIFATLSLDYETYLLPERVYSIRASFYNNYLTGVDANLTIRLTMDVEAHVSSSTSVRYKPEIMKVETNVTSPGIGIQTAWINFSLPKMHTTGSDGWFPLRTGGFTMVYTLSSKFEGKSDTITRQIYVLPPDVKNGRIISTKSVISTSFSGVALRMSPPPSNSFTVITMVTSKDGVSLYARKKVYLSMPDPELKELWRNETHITFEARAASPNGMDSVVFMNSTDGSNWTSICLDTSANDGWICTWNITGLSPGRYYVTAIARDTLGLTRIARVTVEIYGEPDMLKAIVFDWWWIGLGALLGVVVFGSRRLILMANPLLAKEGELRRMLMKRDLDGFRKGVIECLSHLTEKYALVRLEKSMDLSTYAGILREKGILIRESEALLTFSLEYAFSRKPMTLDDARRMYILYLRYKNYLKLRREIRRDTPRAPHRG